MKQYSVLSVLSYSANRLWAQITNSFGVKPLGKSRNENCVYPSLSLREKRETSYKHEQKDKSGINEPLVKAFL